MRVTAPRGDGASTRPLRTRLGKTETGFVQQMRLSSVSPGMEGPACLYYMPKAAPAEPYLKKKNVFKVIVPLGFLHYSSKKILSIQEAIFSCCQNKIQDNS